MIEVELQSVLNKATRERWSTGHFNASELDQMRAIVEACQEVGAPALVGMSEGERKHFGLAEAVAVRNAMRKEYNIPIFLNADHSKSVESAREAIDAGYDSVHIDLSEKPFEENVRGTKEIVEYARRQPPTANRQPPSIEGELGYLKGESKVQKEKIEVSADDYTKPDQAAEFVARTGVDRLAIVVGNIHGISLDEPNLDIERIRQIRQAVPEEVALVLHAGSGISDDQIRAAIQAGIANIHINTELRIAFVGGLKKSLEEHPDEVAMYKLDSNAIVSMQKVVKNKLKLFGSWNRI